MTAIANLWPLLVLAGFGFCVYAVFRLAGRFSPGAVSAGPKTPPDSLIKGQTETAEGLRTIEQRLDARPGSMIERVEASCRELGVSVQGVPPGTTPDQHIHLLLSRLEKQLGFDFASQAATEGFPHESR